MIHRLVSEGAAADPSRPFLVSADATFSYSAATQSAERAAAALVARSVTRLGVYLPTSVRLVIALLGAARAGIELCVVNHEHSESEVEELVGRLRLEHLLSDGSIRTSAAPLSLEDLESEALPPATRDDSLVLVLTTGTTGVPKAARYTWGTLAAQIKRRDDASATRWLLAYNLNHFGGLQMLLHALVNRATLVLPKSLRPADAIAAIEEFEVTHVSATPTFWRMAKAQIPPERLRALPIRHVTLGAEAASGELLDDLRGWFPEARIVHVFAATEVGSCFSVDDGRDGVPLSILEREEGSAVRFRIVDGELQVSSRYGMHGYEGGEATASEGWRATGDLVEVRGDRMFFVGRVSERINVGGVKVDPLPLETRIHAVPGVTLARVYGKPNAITGSIVAVDVVAAEAADRKALETEIRRACADLPAQARPRLVRFVEALETRNAKVVRRSV